MLLLGTQDACSTTSGMATLKSDDDDDDSAVFPQMIVNATH